MNEAQEPQTDRSEPIATVAGMASTDTERKIIVKRAFQKAAEVVVLSAALYRELATSAMSLVHLRSTSDPEIR